jgi:hypothetical protein
MVQDSLSRVLIGAGRGRFCLKCAKYPSQEDLNSSLMAPSAGMRTVCLKGLGARGVFSPDH